MILPGAERAIIDINKLRGYCLNLLHSRGRHKARVFASALNVLRSDAKWLKARLTEAVLLDTAEKVSTDKYGDRYILDFDCTKQDLHARVRSGWIVRRGEAFPRLATCFVLSKTEL